MAADVHLHILEGVTEEEVKLFLSNRLGSKYYDESKYQEHEKRYDELVEKMANTPQVWVGEVSWLKAWLTGDKEAFVPSAVEKVTEVIGEDFPVIDDELIRKVEEAMKLGSGKSEYEVNDPEEVVNFLKEHKGKKVFWITW